MTVISKIVVVCHHGNRLDGVRTCDVDGVRRRLYVEHTLTFLRHPLTQTVDRVSKDNSSVDERKSRGSWEM